VKRWLAALGLAVAACGHGVDVAPGASASSGASSATSASPSASGSAAAASSVRARLLLSAEGRRAASLVTPADQQSRDVETRRAAARALARIGGEAVLAGLFRGLADEDPEVVTWSAYGLGFWCKGHEKEIVSALVARALDAPHPAAPCAPDHPCDVDGTIARAVGKCAAEESEPTLVAWLAGPRARAVAAAYALADVAAAKHKLREETFAALLNLAAGSAAAPPVPEALYPVSRAEHVPPSVVDRVREVATARLAEPGSARRWAVRALGKAGDDAAVELERVVSTPASFDANERAEAARALKGVPRVGPRLLAEALPALVPSSDPIAITGLVSEDTGVLLTVLEGVADALVKDAGEPKKARAELGPKAKKALADLADFKAPKGVPAPVLRRVAWIRCLAAEALARADYKDKALLACDVSEGDPKGDAPEGLPGGTIGARAVVEVLGRAPLEGPRLEAFRVYADRGDLRAREAALELLEKHDEVRVAYEILAHALGDVHAGVIGAACELLAKRPQLAGAPVGKPASRKKKHKKGKVDVDEPAPTAEAFAPSQEIVDALTKLLADPAKARDPELVDGVIDAVAALGMADAKPRLAALCHGPFPTTREHAQKALALLGDKRTCDAPADGGPEPEELARAAGAGPVVVDLDTDAGALTLTLDPAIAPMTVARVSDLARAHFYDGLIVHRVVPGFVSQFGAPDGDGSGGPPGKEPLRCETSPLAFEKGSVGVALAGRDTGSSQLFVMHARHPHLDGLYAEVGSAEGPWAALVDGDRIKRATVRP
jgi:cyclophilin family peptidyl-prolyl cis-trans isomerase/HEAT repeat protein